MNNDEFAYDTYDDNIFCTNKNPFSFINVDNEHETDSNNLDDNRDYNYETITNSNDLCSLTNSGIFSLYILYIFLLIKSN